MRKQLASTPLFWRVFWGNAAVLIVVVAVLVFGPLATSAPLSVTESLSLLACVALALVISLVLMRPAFRPFDELADHMRRHDPLAPGGRVDVEGGPKVTALARAFNEMLDRLEAEQRESARRALMVQEGERQRVARELHDEVGQTLTGVMLQVEGLAAKIPEELREDLDELRETARSGAEDVRRIVRSLRPEALEDLGLRSALAALATAFHDQAGVRVERRLEADLPLSEEQELVFYRVAQEAITNVARHASASRVEIQLRRDDAGVLLMVRDDGVGLAPPTNGPSHGIRGMRERAMLIGPSSQSTVRPTAEPWSGWSFHPTRQPDDHAPEDSHPDRRRPPGRAARVAQRPQRPARPRGGCRGDRIRRAGGDEQYLFEAIRVGASGYVLKTAVDRDLVEACRAAVRGEPFLYPGAVRALMREYLERASAGETLHELTPREEEVVKLVAEAHTNDEIAELLHISKKTVERHRANVLDKLGMRDRVELTRYAIRRGLVEL